MEHRERRRHRDRAEAEKSSALENTSQALHPLAEAQLAELESLYREIPVGLCVVDRELRFLRVNEAYAAIVGRDPRDIIGRTMAEVVHESARGGAVALAQRVIDSGQPAGDIELPGVSREDPSKELTWLVNVHPLKSGSRVEGAVAVLQNVTTVKQAERIATERLEELESLYRNAPIGLAYLDRDLRYVRVNEVLAAINGLSVEEHIGFRPAQLFPEIAGATDLIARRIIDRGEVLQDVEVRLRPPSDPEVEHVFLVGYERVTSRDGSAAGLVVSFHDVTERVRAEEKVELARQHAEARLRELESLSRSLEQEIAERKRVEKTLREAQQMYQDLYDNAPDMYVSVDAATARILECNHTVAAATGYSREEVLGRRVFEMYHADCQEDVKKTFQTFLEIGEVRDAELVLRRKDGTRLEVSLNTSAVRDEAGRILRSRSVWRDISQRKRADRVQQLLIRELDHRVKNTLATVEAMADQSLTSSASLEEFRGSFHGRIGAMARIHEELTRERMAGIDLRRLIEMAVAPFDQGADRRVSLAGSAMVVPLDALRALGMALHELATNAAKHGALSGGRGQVEVSWQQVESSPEARLVIRWVESGGPLLAEPSRRGFGTLFIEEGLEHELGATAHIEFRPSGLRCEITVPLSTPEIG